MPSKLTGSLGSMRVSCNVVHERYFVRALLIELVQEIGRDVTIVSSVGDRFEGSITTLQ